MTSRPRPDLADIVAELTNRHTHREHYTIRRGQTWYGANHLTTVPPLLEQLWHADTPSTAAEDGPRPGYQSKPAARLEALDCLTRIERDTDWWLHHLGHTRAGRGTVAAVRQVHALQAGMATCGGKRHQGCCDAHELEHDIRRWWTQARIVTGWDSPAWKPDNTCPMCSTRGSLRVKLADQAAYCVECGDTWDETNIGLLADHIRVESEAERSPREARVACYCPIILLPGGIARPVVAQLRLCPSCGSARCVHALSQSAVSLDSHDCA